MNNLNISGITTEERRALDGELIKQEIAEMSGTVKAGKAAGPDDVPSASYRKCQPKLLSPLLEMFWTSFRNGLLPSFMRVARIMLLPKPGEPKYKISLLNSDTKILCKALAGRLEGLLAQVVGKRPKWISSRETGFSQCQTCTQYFTQLERSKGQALLLG